MIKAIHIQTRPISYSLLAIGCLLIFSAVISPFYMNLNQAGSRSTYFSKQEILKNQKKSEEGEPNKTKLVQKLVKIDKTKKIILPAEYHPVKNTLEYTSYVGTEDYPTIDGGIINSTDNIPVNHAIPDALIKKPKLLKFSSVNNKNKIKNDENVPEGKTQNTFEDSWATSSHVKNLLTRAVQEGKLNYVLEKTDQMGMPASVAIVPMVESNYQSKAISSKGAAGAWQLMPSVAKDYGIKNQERFEFSTSTDTALKLLNKLHQQFGNWSLAFAAYNAGPQRVQEAIKKNPHASNIDDLDLPRETKDYVKKIMNLNKEMINMDVNHVK